MADIAVTADHINTLAEKHDTVTADAETATLAATDIKARVNMSHGTASVWSNNAFAKAEKARREACEALQEFTAELASKLRTAAAAYENIDKEAGQNIALQVLPR